MRIRSIKPEFWNSDDIAALTWDERLLFIGLWSYVADSGVGRDNDKLIAADLFPLEDDPIETLATVSRGLASLSAAGLITRYRVGSKRFLHITSWSEHQKIDRPTRSPFPAPTCEDAVIEEPSRGSREPSLPGSRDQGSKGSRERGSKGLSSDESNEMDRFDEFWAVYDKKVNRKAAEAKWKLALKRVGVTPGLLIAAAGSYVTYERTHNQGGRFVMDPAKWLNGHRWEDERSGRERPPEQHQSRASQWLQLAADMGEPPAPQPPANVREIGQRR